MFYKLYELIWEFNDSSFSLGKQRAIRANKRAVVMITAMWAVSILIVTILLNMVLSAR